MLEEVAAHADSEDGGDHGGSCGDTVRPILRVLSSASERTKTQRAVRGKVLNMIAHREALKGEMTVFEQGASDPNRFKVRGYNGVTESKKVRNYVLSSSFSQQFAFLSLFLLLSGSLFLSVVPETNTNTTTAAAAAATTERELPKAAHQAGPWPQGGRGRVGGGGDGAFLIRKAAVPVSFPSRPSSFLHDSMFFIQPFSLLVSVLV